MKKYAFLILMIVSLSCKDKKNETVAENKTETPVPKVVDDSVKDSAEIRTVVMDFYNWYNKNYTRFQEYNLYSSIRKKDLPPYKINWDVVEKYQQFIKTAAPQLGDAFMSNQRSFFRQCDSAFKVDVEDDIPYGFDYDWYTNSQEDPQYLLDGINKSGKWMINIKGDDATVEIGAPEDKNYTSGSLLIQLDLKKESGQWKIAKIGND